MPAPIRTCQEHGYVEGEPCPVCGAPGEHLLDGDRRRRLSTSLSGALRHFPTDAGVELDEAGWTPLSSLVGSAGRQYDWVRREHVDGVIATDPKGRFEREHRDGRSVVRAAYGHSVDVNLDVSDSPVPDTLYHGTAPENLPSIRTEGLKPMGRQHVHLSGTVADAREVGLRHAADPAILVVNAAAMTADGHDITKRGRKTYTTDRVPPAYLDRLDGQA